MFIPLSVNKKNLLENFAHKIAPIVNFLILPIFAFANSGIKISNFSAETFSQPLVFGIIFAMFFGKQIGVMLFSYLVIKFKFANLPQGVNWLEFYGAAIFTGIGFTMSIFIAGLAFVENDTLVKIILDEVKLAILIGSILSILYGSFITLISLTKNQQV
jgi:NhaA family Na+:H+ antiporter